MTTYWVNEIYTCLQGEGIMLGVPSVLVRFHICNLRCTWCDTPYTHTYKSDPDAKRYPLEELATHIVSFGIPHVMFTGGEPTLQNLGLLARHLPSHYTIEVETNGTRIPHQDVVGFEESDYRRMQWNVSFKDENAGQKLVPEAMKHWAHLATTHPAVYFKCVIRRDFYKADFEKVQQWCSFYQIDPNRMILMAEGTTWESQIHCEWLYQLCLENGYRFTPRLHILTFGNKRHT